MKERKYRNIRSANQLLSLILVESLKPTALRGLTSYGIASVLGTAFLPVGVASIMLGMNDVGRNNYGKEKSGEQIEKQRKGSLDGYSANMTKLAERSGLERTHLYRKLKQLDVKLGKRGEE